MGYTSQQVLKYIKKIHKKGFSLDHTVQNHAEWELANIPVADLKIDSEDDPYNRVLDLDQDHVDSITQQDILAHAIVADENGHIIDGNHRVAKAQALGMRVVPAFIPVVDPDASLGPVNEAVIDNVKGAGAVPYNADVDYFGLRVKMKPSTFLKLAAPLGQPHSAELEKYIAGGGAIGAPFLDIAVPPEWDDNDFSKSAQIKGHEGRNRMTAILKLEGDKPIETHLFVKYYRARDITPPFVDKLNSGLYAEKSTHLIGGPLFTTGVSESVMENDIKIDHKARAKAWIEKVYAKYPGTWQNNHVMTWGEGDDQQLAMFELIPSMSKKDAVEVKWFQAYPLRQGVGSRAMTELKIMAQEDGIALTLYPWDKGQVSQAKLTKFYKAQGFQPTVKGAKNMVWTPESLDEAFDQPYPMTWEKSEADDSMDALARLPDGSNLSIMFTSRWKEGEEVIQVEFYRNNSQENGSP